MSKIKLTSDGYSFHTLELKIHPKYKEYAHILKCFYQRSNGSHSGTTYPLTKYNTTQKQTHCSTLLSKNGILLYFTSTQMSGIPNATIKAVINPRKVIDPSCSYLGIMPADERSLEQFQEQFTLLMRKYHLPEFLDQWNLTRLDLCVNIQFNNKKSASEISRLLRKDLFYQKIERVLCFNPNSDSKAQTKQKNDDLHTLKLKNDSYCFVTYDKLYQMDELQLFNQECQWRLPKGLLRIELQCYSPYLGKLAQKEKLKHTSEVIRHLTLHSRSLILKQIKKVFTQGEHLKPLAARTIIQSSPYQKHTQKQLLWMFDRMRRPFSLEQLTRGMVKKFGIEKRTVLKRLDQLQKLGINPIPLRNDFYLDILPSLPLIMESLEDDSCRITIDNTGHVSY